MHAEYLSSMLLPACYWELGSCSIQADIKELDAPVSACCEELVLMLLAPRQIEQAVLRLEVFLANDAVGREVEVVEASVAYEAEVCAGADGEARVEEG